jgi:hypothetical protein
MMMRRPPQTPPTRVIGPHWVVRLEFSDGRFTTGSMAGGAGRVSAAGHAAKAARTPRVRAADSQAKHAGGPC